MNGHRVQDWSVIEWQYINTDVQNIRHRIYVASKLGNLREVANLQKLMMRSRANWLQSIRRVTQINRGRKTPGIDGRVVTSSEERIRLFDELADLTINQWNPPPTKRIVIPKANGQFRPLGIPTVKDRVIQAIVKNALEPFWEARFEATSYGFRPGRSPPDAIGDIWRTLNSRK